MTDLELLQLRTSVLEKSVADLQNQMLKILEMQGEITNMISTIRRIGESHTASIQMIADLLKVPKKAPVNLEKVQ